MFGIVGAKGGVGTTTVAVNLAVELARIAPRQTLLIDLHLSHGDAAVMLGVEPRFSVLDALQNTRRLDESVFRGLVTPTDAGVDLLASSNTWTTVPSIDGVKHLIALTARLYRYVVLDLPRSGAATVGGARRISRASSWSPTRSSRRFGTPAAWSPTCSAAAAHERVSVLVSRFDPQSDIRRQDIEKVVKVPIRHSVPERLPGRLARPEHGASPDARQPQPARGGVP